MTPTSKRPERLLHKSLESSFTTAEDGIENWEFEPVDASSRRPGRRPTIEGEEFLNESADALFRASQPHEDVGSGRPHADCVLGGTRRDQLIEAGKVAVHRTQRNIGALRNVGPGRAEDAFLGVESYRSVHDPSPSLRAGGGPTRHPVGSGRHD